MGADTGENALQLLQTVLSIKLDGRGVSSCGKSGWWCVSSPSVPACIVNEQAACASLIKRCVPERLNIQVCDDEAAMRMGPGAIFKPVRHVELQEKLGDCAVAQLFKSGPPIINAT